MKKSTLISLLLLCIIPLACREKETEADAWGNFEATETMMSSESAGRIVFISAPEGIIVEKGSVIAIIDTTLLSIQKKEIRAGIATIVAKVNALRLNNSVIRQQIANLDISIERTKRMIDDQAATLKQLDDLTGQKAVLERQIQVNDAQATAIETEKRVLEVRMAQTEEQISRCSVRAPVTGTIMKRYAEVGEVAAPGKPIARIADLTTMKLKAFVSGAQLGQVQPGRDCKVRVDNGRKEFRYYEGTISTVASRAEFTPRIIQTKEERINLVYAVTILVTNDGFIRTGMPGEAIFNK